MNSSNASSKATPSSPGDCADAANTVDAGQSEQVLDLRGEICPYTFVRTRLRLEALPIGETLRVVVDYQPAAANIPRSAREWGQEVVEVKDSGDGEWHICLRKQVE